MNRDTMHYTARLAAMDIIEWTHCDNQHECPDYPTERIVSLLEGMQREIEQANEDGELLAYNCEKRVKQEVIDKACGVIDRIYRINAQRLREHTSPLLLLSATKFKDLLEQEINKITDKDSQL